VLVAPDKVGRLFMSFNMTNGVQSSNLNTKVVHFRAYESVAYIIYVKYHITVSCPFANYITLPPPWGEHVVAKFTVRSKGVGLELLLQEPTNFPKPARPGWDDQNHRPQTGSEMPMVQP
jgi:hypothetical protein